LGKRKESFPLIYDSSTLPKVYRGADLLANESQLTVASAYNSSVAGGIIQERSTQRRADGSE